MCPCSRKAALSNLVGQINCVGQTPASGLVAEAAPNAIGPSGHIRVKPTLEIDDDALPNVFVCGDVADTKVANPNSKSATRQAEVAAYNVAMAARGKEPVHTYQEAWVDRFINLTVGFVSIPIMVGFVQLD